MTDTKVHLRHIPELDGLRGIAVLGVVLLHFHAPFLAAAPFGPISKLIDGGWAGVDIFFVLSGFLITSILLSTNRAENYFTAFYARRALRIFPVYFLTLAVYFGAILPWSHRHGLVLNFHSSEQVWYWTFLGNWRQGLNYNDGAGIAHFWTLAIEEQFYILFSILVYVLRRETLVKVCIGLITMSIALRFGFAVTGHTYPLLTRLTPMQLDPIALGALLACSPRARELAARWAAVLIPLGILTVYLPILGILPALEFLGPTAAALAACGALSLSLKAPIAVLRSGILRSLGKYSYAMYVFHDFLAGAVAHMAKKNQSLGFALAAVVGGTLVSYAIAWLSWHILEERILRLKSRFPYRIAAETPLAS